ncbi:MAG: hypothetical protein ABMB14_11625 [Myxococcota bacterium]
MNPWIAGSTARGRAWIRTIGPPRAGSLGAALATATSTIACTCNSLPPGQQPGELGHGAFSWRCVDDADAFCPHDGSKPQGFPEAVAVGGRFGLAYFPLSGTVTSISSPTSMIAVDQTGPEVELTAVSPGWAAVIAYQDDEVLDVIHLRIVEPDRIDLTVPADPIDVGAFGFAQATPRADDGQVCAGSISYAWSVDPQGIVDLIVGPSPSNRVDLFGVAPGIAEVGVVTALDRVTAEVEVDGEVPPPDTASTGTGPTDTGTTTTGTGSTGSTGSTGTGSTGGGSTGDTGGTR